MRFSPLTDTPSGPMRVFGQRLLTRRYLMSLRGRNLNGISGTSLSIALIERRGQGHGDGTLYPRQIRLFVAAAATIKEVGRILDLIQVHQVETRTKTIAGADAGTFRRGNGSHQSPTLVPGAAPQGHIDASWWKCGEMGGHFLLSIIGIHPRGCQRRRVLGRLVSIDSGPFGCLDTSQLKWWSILFA